MSDAVLQIQRRGIWQEQTGYQAGLWNPTSFRIRSLIWNLPSIQKESRFPLFASLEVYVHLLFYLAHHVEIYFISWLYILLERQYWVEWSGVLVCPGLKGFQGHGASSTKPRTAPGKSGWLCMLLSVKSMGCRTRLSRFESWLYRLLAVWFWASYLITLTFTFPFCKMGIIIVFNIRVVRIKWVNMLMV